MIKITISQEGANPISITLTDNNIKTKENFPITRSVEFDPYKFLLVVAQTCEQLRKQIPIKFEKENFRITNISYISVGDVKKFKDDIYSDPLDFIYRGGIVNFELYYIDKTKHVPNHNECVKTMNATVVNTIKQNLLKNGFRVDLFLDNGDYPIDLQSDYRGKEISLFVKLKDNSENIKKYEKEFNSFCEKAFKPFIGKKLGQKSTIIKIEPYDNYSDGMHVICDNLDDVDNDYDLMYELENKFNKAIANCPLAKIYNIKFVEDGYYEDLCFYCSVKPKNA
jgi:hypothetical protein